VFQLCESLPSPSGESTVSCHQLSKMPNLLFTIANKTFTLLLMSNLWIYLYVMSAMIIWYIWCLWWLLWYIWCLWWILWYIWCMWWILWYIWYMWWILWNAYYACDFWVFLYMEKNCIGHFACVKKSRRTAKWPKPQAGIGPLPCIFNRAHYKAQFFVVRFDMGARQKPIFAVRF
jgi:hypothetical protein